MGGAVRNPNPEQLDTGPVSGKGGNQPVYGKGDGWAPIDPVSGGGAPVSGKGSGAPVGGKGGGGPVGTGGGLSGKIGGVGTSSGGLPDGPAVLNALIDGGAAASMGASVGEFFDGFF